jgi:tRNA (guanine-N7-)-methyltransferase
VRVRQHVNPLVRELIVPAAPPTWGDAFADPTLPLVVDIGCGYGRFLLLLAKVRGRKQ